MKNKRVNFPSTIFSLFHSNEDQTANYMKFTFFLDDSIQSYRKLESQNKLIEADNEFREQCVRRTVSTLDISLKSSCLEW